MDLVWDPTYIYYHLQLGYLFVMFVMFWLFADGDACGHSNPAGQRTQEACAEGIPGGLSSPLLGWIGRAT